MGQTEIIDNLMLNQVLPSYEFQNTFGIHIILDFQSAGKTLWVQFCNFSMLKRRKWWHDPGEDELKYEKIYVHILTDSH